MSVAADARILVPDARAAVTAGVVERGDGAIVATQDEDGPGTDLQRAVVATLGNLGLGGYEQPMPAEEIFHLGVVEHLVGEERARQGKPRAVSGEQSAHVLPQGFGDRAALCRGRGALALNGCRTHRVRLSYSTRVSQPRN